MQRLIDWLNAQIEVPRPWTRAAGIARSLLALQAAVTLLLTPSEVLFMPMLGVAEGPRCEASGGVSLFCLLGAADPAAVQGLTAIVLLVIATGILPALTAVPLWYGLWSVSTSIAIPDGGDQLAAIIAFLLIPLSLSDWRMHAWGGPGLSSMIAPRAAVAAVALLAVRVQISVVYLGSGVGKLQSDEWLSGTAIYVWLRHPTFGAPAWIAQPLHDISVAPLVTATITWSTVALELLLGIALLLPNGFRIRVLLPAGLLLHMGIFLILGIASFSVVMFAALILLLVPSTADERVLVSAFPSKREGTLSVRSPNAV